MGTLHVANGQDSHTTCNKTIERLCVMLADNQAMADCRQFGEHVPVLDPHV